MKINGSNNSCGYFVRIPILRARISALALGASAALFLCCGTSFAQSASRQKPATGRTSSVPSVSEGVAPNPNGNSGTKSTPKMATPAVHHAPAVAYLLLESAQGPVNGEATDAMHRNWITLSAFDKGSIADGAATGQATEGMDHKNISDGAAKGQAVDAMAQDKSVSDGAAKAQSPDAVAPGVPALDASSKDAAKMDAASGASSGSRNGSFTVMKEIDKATPMLRQASVSGQHFPSAQLDVLDGGVWHHYQLTDVTIGSVQSTGGGSMPAENISFTYQKIEMK
ncbi:MAG: type VI secretion system tube protein Hcp [Candidatus Acidiferrales bacterium]